MKNCQIDGGLNITDVECLNRSLKLRQFLRTSKSKHPLCKIQCFCLENLGLCSQLMQEYCKITTKEAVIESAQETINSLCDHTRKIIVENLAVMLVLVKCFDIKMVKSSEGPFIGSPSCG